MQTPATPANLASFYSGSVSPNSQQEWLDKVWRALLIEDRSLEVRAAADPLLLQVAGDVVVSATLRILRNPEGRKQEAGQLDDYSESWTNVDSTEDVFFTTAEKRRVAAPSETGWNDGWSGSIQYAG